MKFEKKKEGENPLTSSNPTGPVALRGPAGRRPAAAWPAAARLAAAAGLTRARLQIQGEREENLVGENLEA